MTTAKEKRKLKKKIESSALKLNTQEMNTREVNTQEMNTREVNTQEMDNGWIVTREQYLKIFASNEDLKYQTPLIYDDKTLLHGFSGLFYFFIYDAIQIVTHIIESGGVSSIRQEELTYLFQDLANADKLVLNKTSPFKIIQNFFIIEKGDEETKRVVRNFLSDPRYDMSLTEKAFSQTLIMSLKIESNNSSVENRDWDGFRLVLKAIYEIQYKNLKSNKRITGVTLTTGKNDCLLDLDVRLSNETYSKKELNHISMHPLFRWSIEATDIRNNEEKILKNSYPYFNSQTIGDLALSQYQRGKARGGSNTKDVITYDDNFWKMSYITPMLNSFEREITFLTKAVVKDYKSIVRTHSTSLDISIHQLMKNNSLQNKINLLNRLIQINVLDVRLEIDKDTESIEPINSLIEKSYEKDVSEIMVNHTVYLRILSETHHIRQIRNTAMHGGKLSDNEIQTIELWTPRILKLIHSLLYAKNNSDILVDPTTGLPNWFTVNSPIIYNNAVDFRYTSEL